MPEPGRLDVPAAPATGARCLVRDCQVCAMRSALDERRRPVTVAEWLAERLRPALERRRQRRRDRVARLRAGAPAVTTGPWPYSSWWDEASG